MEPSSAPESVPETGTQLSSDMARYGKVPVVERNLAGGRLLIQRLDMNRPTQLSGSAPLIWDLLDELSTVDELVTLLVDRFADSADTIEAGVRKALGSLEAQGLVRTL